MVGLGTGFSTSETSCVPGPWLPGSRYLVSTEMFMSWAWPGVGVREKGEAGGEKTMGVARVGGGDMG